LQVKLLVSGLEIPLQVPVPVIAAEAGWLKKKNIAISTRPVVRKRRVRGYPK
jgi:hypothetical protein